MQTVQTGAFGLGYLALIKSPGGKGPPLGNISPGLGQLSIERKKKRPANNLFHLEYGRLPQDKGSIEAEIGRTSTEKDSTTT